MLAGRGGKIYLRTQDGLIPLEESEYSAEDVLQSLLSDYPDLLAGEQIQPRQPRRWLLITREAGIRDSETSQGRWSVDHLFLDQDSVPTLVEVKRSTDTRIRREVVGQMLDYAANVAAYWKPGEIRELFDRRCRTDGRDPDVEVTAFLGETRAAENPDGVTETKVEDFWQRASDNLASRRMRLLFVADVIPPELQRIIEFLNESMARTEVLGVEVRQFVGHGQQTLVPRVIGHTALAEDVKRPAGKAAALDPDAFFERLRTRGLGEDVIAREFYEWAVARGLRIWLGRAYMSPMWDHPTGRGYEFTFDMNVGGIMGVGFAAMARRPSFGPRERRLELCRRLSAVPGLAISDEAIDTAAKWRIKDLADAAARRAFLEVFDWVVEQYEADWAHGVPAETTKAGVRIDSGQ